LGIAKGIVSLFMEESYIGRRRCQSVEPGRNGREILPEGVASHRRLDLEG
jgi:hypothetical protein